MIAPAPVRRLDHSPALDGLRAVAVFVVISYHTSVLFLRDVNPIAILGARSTLTGGFLGVDVFFVLSGFLITALLLREQGDHNGRVRLGAFYGRRALRLLPALVVLLAAHAVYAAFADLPASPEERTSLFAFVYVNNWQAVWSPNTVAEGLGHLWSLSVEEQFYLIWPTILIFLLGLRRSARAVTAMLVVAIALIALHRALLWRQGTSWIFLLIRTDTRMDTLLVGALLASLWVRGRTPTRGLIPAAWLSAGLLTYLFLFTRDDAPWLYLGGFLLVAVAAAIIVLAAVDGRWPVNRIFELTPLQVIGRGSYGLYLWHLPIFIGAARYTTDLPNPTRVVLAYGLTAAATAASYVLVERRTMNLRRALRPKPTSQVA